VRRVERIMGTAMSLEVADEQWPSEAVEAAFSSLREADDRFSTWKPDSEVSRIQRGELTVDAASADVREVADRCAAARRITGGAFDAWRHRPDGAFDPTGLVKGWAIERAAGMLVAAGATDLFLAGGGDMAVRGTGPSGDGWRVGIQHPTEKDLVAAVLVVRDGAVATSGSYERGDHVVNPLTGLPPRGLWSVTVVGPSLTDADAYATAAFAMGEAGISWIESVRGYAGLALTTDQRLLWSEGFSQYFEQPRPAHR
jgi:FAD:protein FMN transferase